MKKNKIILIVLLMFLAFSSCKTKDKTDEIDQVTPKKTYEPSLDKRVKAYQGQLFDKMNNKTSSGSYSFASSNIMWRASLMVLSDIPLSSIDYGAGMIITDWYSNGTNESIKINISFNSNEVSVSSIEVKAFKRICNSENQCSVSKAKDSLAVSIKEKIITKIREIKVQEEKKKS